MIKEVVELLKKALDEIDIDLKKEQIEKLIEIPPSVEMGDYAFPCFFLAEKLKMNPHDCALEVRGKITEPSPTDFEDIEVDGPYVNFIVNKKSLARQVVWDVITQKKNYGKLDIGKRKKIIVEYSSTNLAKPFGIGHLRSTIIGNSIANILEFQGYNAIRINYLGDWGTQFGRLLFGYKKFGSEKQLEKKPIETLFKIYVKSNKKIYEKKAREEFKKLEEGDRKSLMLWKIFKDYSLEEFSRVYKELGIKFDVYEGESHYNKQSKKILDELSKRNILKKSKGAQIVDLSSYGLGVSIIEKADGTTLYATRDLAAAISRYEKYKFEKMIYEVGEEQRLYFKQLFKILELMGYKWAKNCVHADHGLYLDSSGKKFSTRKGKTVLIQDILDETTSLVKKEIRKRDKKISEKKLNERAKKIAIAAIFYGDMKNSRANNIIFDIKKFVSFDGNTGPYLLYSYARASSIMKKAPPVQKKFEVFELEPKEFEFAKKISEFSQIVSDAASSLNPAVIANYCYSLAQLFNEFYHACKVIGSEQEAFRLALVQSFRQVMKNALGLLGIETIEEM